MSGIIERREERREGRAVREGKIDGENVNVCSTKDRFEIIGYHTPASISVSSLIMPSNLYPRSMFH